MNSEDYLDAFECGSTDWVTKMTKDELEEHLSHLVHLLNDEENDLSVNEINRHYMERAAEQFAEDEKSCAAESRWDDRKEDVYQEAS